MEGGLGVCVVFLTYGKATNQHTKSFDVFDEIPPVREHSYSLRSLRQYDPAVSRTASFSNIHF